MSPEELISMMDNDNDDRDPMAVGRGTAGVPRTCPQWTGDEEDEGDEGGAVPARGEVGVAWNAGEYLSDEEQIKRDNGWNDYIYSLCLYRLSGIYDAAYNAYMADESIEMRTDGSLYRKKKHGTGYIERKMRCPPLRKDLLGKVCYAGNVFADKSVVADGQQGGWKIHVSATPSSAVRVVETVVPFLMREKLDWKVIINIGQMRRQYEAAVGSEYSQYGKFIAIYPKNESESSRVAAELDKLLSTKLRRTDFVTCSGDFEIGSSGGLFTRYVTDYSANDREVQVGDDRAVRAAPIISALALDKACASLPAFPISYYGIQLGKIVIPAKEGVEETVIYDKEKFKQEALLLGLINPAIGDRTINFNDELLREPMKLENYRG
jgi:hypothetical protein